MITPAERVYIYEHAYVPEHLPHYVTAISQTEPFLFEDFVMHVAGSHLIFTGYPLSQDFNETQVLEKLYEAKERFKPETISIIAPNLPVTLECDQISPSDAYYRIDLSELHIPKKVRNMLARARQELSIQIGRFGKEHKKLIDDFLWTHHINGAGRFIFRRVDEYVKCKTALVFEARNWRGDLVAFDVAEFGARQYAFYMFNFRPRTCLVPGASDLLLAHIIERAIFEDKRFVNLGLGINAGIAFFKQKWGASPVLSYVSSAQGSHRKASWGELFEQFSGL